MKKRFIKTLVAVSIFLLPVAAQAATVTHYFEATRTEIKGALYRQSANTADASTVNRSGNGRRVAVTIQAYSKNGNYDSGSWKRNDGGSAYVKTSSSNVKTWESAHSTSGTSDKWVWLHVNG